MKRLALCIALLLIAIPATAAPLDVRVYADSARATGIESTTGDLVALAVEDLDGSAQASGIFALDAVQMRHETDSVMTAVSFGPGSQPTFVEPSTTIRDHASARLEGTTNRPGFRLLVTPLAGSTVPTITLTGGCLDLEVSPIDRFQRSALIQHPANRPSINVDASTAILLTDCGEDTTAHITGDFQVTLWEWDAQLTTSTGSTAIRSGYQTNSPTPDASAGPAQEHFMMVNDANLTLTVSQSVLVNAPRLDGFASLAFTNAHAIAPALNLEAREIVATNGASAALTAKDRVLSADLTGDDLTLTADGHSQLVRPVTEDSPTWRLMAGATAGIVAVLVVVVRRLGEQCSHAALTQASRGNLARARFLLLVAKRRTYAWHYASGLVANNPETALGCFQEAYVAGRTLNEARAAAAAAATAARGAADEQQAAAWDEVGR